MKTNKPVIETRSQVSARWLRHKKQMGWKSTSFVAPPECVDALRDFYRIWKREHKQLWLDAREDPPKDNKQ